MIIVITTLIGKKNQDDRDKQLKGLIISLVPELSLYSLFYFILDNKYISILSFLKLGYFLTIVSMTVAMTSSNHFYSLLGYYMSRGFAAAVYMIVVILTVRYFPT